MEQIYLVVEQYVEIIIQWAILLCEFIGVLMIVLTAIRGVIAWIRKNERARLIAAEGIAIALTFKMGGEVLRTVIVRDWQELLILGAVVLLRVVMAFIIHFEIRSERQLLESKPNGEASGEEKDKKKKPPIIRL